MRDDLERALAAAQRGDEDAFALVWRAHHPSLLRYLRVSLDRDEADDVASATWLDVARSLQRFEGDIDGFRGWLFTIARRRLVDSHRTRARRIATSPLDEHHDDRLADGAHGSDPSQVVVDRSGTEAALDLIAGLSPDRRDVVALRVIADLDVASVANILGKQPGAVRVATHRGLRDLAERLAPEHRSRGMGGNTPVAPDDLLSG
jgi:RNA polymerase sigma-70 factor (ECF subfamily)